MTNFIPPIPIGQFKPSSDAIASWLYEIWKYLQENHIPSANEVTNAAETVAENYVTATVPPMIANAINSLSYAGFVNDTTLPIYRASNDEIDNQDLLEAWDQGCRFALVDDEAVFVMIKDGNTINLLQILTEQQSTGVVSVNGKTGIVILTTNDITNDSGYITEAALTGINQELAQHETDINALEAKLSYSTGTSITNLNSLFDTVIAYNNNWLGVPTGVSSSGTVIEEYSPIDLCALQKYIPFGTGRIWYREYTNGTWTAWNQIPNMLYYDNYTIPSPVTIGPGNIAEIDTGITGIADNDTIVPKYLVNGIMMNAYITSGTLRLSVYNPSNVNSITVSAVWFTVLK